MSGTFGMTILIDWGTDTLRWSAEDESFSMPNLAVSVSHRQKVCAVGNEAATLLREHPELHALVPPRGILFADTEAIIAQLHEIRQQTVREKPWWKRLLLPRIFAAVPLGTTEFEAHGFSRILKQEGQSVILIEAPTAAAAGCGYRPEEETPFAVLDLGAGFTQFAVLRNGVILSSGVLRRGGRDLDTALKRYCRKQSDADPSIAEVREAKTIWNRHDSLRIGSLQLEQSELRKLWTPYWEQVAQMIEETLNDPVLHREVAERGVTMVGGLSQMPGFGEFLSERLGMRFQTANNPSGAVLHGLEKLLPELSSKVWQHRR